MGSPKGLPPAPAGMNLSEDRRFNIVAASVATCILAMLAVVLRNVSRKLKGNKMWLDDWLALASLPPAVVTSAMLSGYAVAHGFGLHIWATPPDSLYAWTISVFVGLICYPLGLVLSKLSILAFYWRLFSIRGSMRLSIWALTVVVFLWGMACILLALLQCRPVYAFWSRVDPRNPLSPSDYHCDINQRRYYYGTAIPNIVTDLAILGLPAPYIWQLHLPIRQKLAVTGIFLVGLFVTLVSTIRLKYLAQYDFSNPDITWDCLYPTLWTLVELNVAVVCACLPLLRPVFSKITCGIFNRSSTELKDQREGGSLRLGHQRVRRMWEVGSYGNSSTYINAGTTDDKGTDGHPLALYPSYTSGQNAPA